MFHPRDAGPAHEWFSTTAIADRPDVSARMCAPAWAPLLEHGSLRLTGRSGRPHNLFFTMRNTRQAHSIELSMRATTGLVSPYMELIV